MNVWNAKSTNALAVPKDLRLVHFVNLNLDYKMDTVSHVPFNIAKSAQPILTFAIAAKWVMA